MITYKKLDHFPKEIDDIRHEIDNIVKLAMVADCNYEYIQLLIKYNSYFNSLNNIIRWADNFDGTIDTDSKSQMTQYIVNIADFLNLKHNNDSNFDTTKYWGKIRGTILEECISYKLIPKYKFQKFKDCEVGCVINIDNKFIITNKLKTVDFSGNCSKNKICEVVEIKTNPNNLSEDNINLFSLIKFHLDKINYNAYFYFITNENKLLTQNKINSISSETKFIKCFSSSISDINTLKNTF